MIDFKITIIIAVRDGSAPIFPADAAFPEDVDIITAGTDGGRGLAGIYADNNITADYATAKTLLLITDSAALAGEAAHGEKVVFVGSPSGLDSLDAVSDVWLPSDDRAVLMKRAGRIVSLMRNELECRFYKDTLLTTINTVPDMLWYKRIDGIHTMVNDAFTGIVHKPKSDIVGRDHFYIWDAPRPADGNDFACAESEEKAISSGRTYICDEPVKTREGMKHFRTYKTPVYDPFGNIFGTVGVGHDVTNFSNLGIQLSILVENMPFPMTIFSPDWKVVKMNRAFREIVRTDNTDSFDYRQWKQAVPVYAGSSSEDKSRHLTSGEYRIEYDGSVRNYMITELEIRDYFDNLSGYFCTMQDITYQRSYEESIIRTANTDMLTGMYNRRYFYSYMNKHLKNSFCLLYMDLDRFKLVNDTHGHRSGDEVLVTTAGLIREHFPDAVAARLGGDEFAVITGSADREDIVKKCEHLEAAVAEKFAGYGCGLGMSIGIVYNDGSEPDIDKLIHQSDEMMYIEKKKHHGEQ